MFESGIAIPSIDKEIYINRKFEDVRMINLVYGDEVFKFILDVEAFIEKIVVFFNQNQVLECEVVTKENVIALEEVFDNQTWKLITIKN